MRVRHQRSTANNRRAVSRREHNKTLLLRECGATSKQAKVATRFWQQVASILVKILPFIAAGLLFLFAFYTSLDPRLYWTIAAAIKPFINNVNAALPDISLSQAFSVVLFTTAFLAPFTESFKEIIQSDKQRGGKAGSLGQANSYVLTKLLHAIAPFLLVITAFSLWDVCVYCVAQAGLQPLLGALLPGLRMGQALAGLLTFAGATALIIEGYYVLWSKDKDTFTQCTEYVTGMAATAQDAALQHAHVHDVGPSKQDQKRAATLQPFSAKTSKAADNAAPVESVVNSSKVPAGSATIKAHHSPNRQTGGGSRQSGIRQGQQKGNNGQTGRAQANNAPESHSSTNSPAKHDQAVSKKNAKGKKQPTATNAARNATDASKTSTQTRKNMNTDTDRQDKAGPASNSAASSINGAKTVSDDKQSHNDSKTHGRRNNKRQGPTAKHLNPSASTTATNQHDVQRNPPQAKPAVGCNDAYMAIVVGLLRGASMASAAVQVQLANRMADLFKAVPRWMLTFGCVNKENCTARLGLELFQSLLNGKMAQDEMLSACAVPGKTNDMVLLLKTLVAAYVEQQLAQSSRGTNSNQSEGRLMAKDVLRMAPVPGMPRCLYQAPEWHLKALCNNLGVGLRCEKTDGSVWDGAPGKAINITVQFVGSTYTLLDG